MFMITRTTMIAAFLALASLADAAPAATHCDSLDGPVVQAAREALAAGEVEEVLIWVRPEDEAEIRTAFTRTLEVRRAGGEARDLADLWFFETLVRVHRAGEGAPYTGLKPVGWEAPAGIEVADRALEAGSIDAVVDATAGELADALRDRFQHVLELRDYDPADVNAGRRYVHAYVQYIHFVGEVRALLHSH
jgi:hypothetical protein